jgi:hypothetical protein
VALSFIVAAAEGGARLDKLVAEQPAARTPRRAG